MFKSVIGKISRTGRKLSELSGAELQERLDLIKAAMLVKALGDGMYKDDRNALFPPIMGRKKEDFDRLADEIVAMPVGQMQSTIQTYMEKQMDEYLKSINTVSASFDAKTLASAKNSIDRVNLMGEKQKESMNWGLEVKASSIPTAGNGVFLNGRIRPGTFLTVLPGTVYLRQHIVDPQFFQPLTKVKSDYKYWSYDGLIIDSTGYVPTSPVAVGHLVNHPADPARAALKPNVMVVPFEFTRKQGQLYPHLIPNRYVAPEKFMYKVANNHVIANSFVRSLGLISISEIENEELLLDYRLPPKGQPAWYKQIDDSTLRRWNLPVEADKALHEEEK